ncbi:MAG: hypothetical protein Q9207_004760 [Kuettlingeria erythrocarpa]
MDPVTAFGLAAGILQVVSVSFQAIELCRSLYKEGSLAEYDETTEITAQLGIPLFQALRRTSTRCVTAMSRSHDDQEVLDLSQNCSKLGKELIEELKKLRLEKGRLRQAIQKSVFVLRRKAAIKEKQDLLEKYQRVLDTRILLNLDTRSLKETQDMQRLDQSVQQLVAKLEQGNNTVAQLLASHNDILVRIEGKLDNDPSATADQPAHKQLLDGLFFYKIVSPQDQIQDAFDGTCRWIFNQTTDDTPKPWSNFPKWLETENGVYWISGKPGAGKSTLMKYVVNEDLTSQLLAKWERGTDLLVVTFFFWQTGEILQKSLEGLLRSLLYQIAAQWPGLAGLLDMRQGKGSGEPLRSLPEWTDQRLLSLLQRFLGQKPDSISVCAFIDGLDEFIGDEDTLLDIVRSFSKTPRCKICVSSRPAQVFRHEFQLCPKLRVQDLDRQDIERMIDQRETSGVFLWLDLVIKDLIKELKNEDTFEELQSRIDRTPETFYGMYARSLTNSGPLYLETGLSYLRVLLTAVELGTDITLQSLALAEPGPWESVARYELGYFTSHRFRSTCERLETRLLSRCGSLVEIDENEDGGVDCDPLIYYNRNINFMHRTAVEFLREEYKSFFLDEFSSAKAAAEVARCKIGMLVLASSTQREEIQTHIFAASNALKLVGYFTTASGLHESFRAVQVNLMHTALGSLQKIHKERNPSLKGDFSNDTSFWEWLCDPRQPTEETSKDRTVAPWSPIVDDLSTAAFFGCHYFFQFLVSKQVCSMERMSSMLHAALCGWESDHSIGSWSFVAYRAGITIIQEMLQYHVNPNAVFSMRPEKFQYIQHASLWARVLVSVLQATKIGLAENTTVYLAWEAWEAWEASCTDLIERLLILGADPNTRIAVHYRWYMPKGNREAFLYVEESPLAVWNWLDRRIAQRLARIGAQLRSAGATYYRRFRYIGLRGSVYPITLTQSQDMHQIMSSGLEKAEGASSWHWFFENRPAKVLDGESYNALTDIIKSVVAEESLEREAAIMSLPPGLGELMLEDIEGRWLEDAIDEDDTLSRSSYAFSEVSSRNSTELSQGPGP